jgi:protein O-GlcNAc transferase
VWNALVKGWFRHLDGSRIELHVFHLGPLRDGETAWAESRSASFTQGNRTLRDWATAVIEKDLDALIYPEIGMDSTTIKLASLRLVPVQIATWGHPETTGLPTIDYYLSAETFEPIDAADNYSEKLIALPNLGCAYLPLAVTSVDADLPALGIDTNIPILLSPGTPYKYAPQNDKVFVDIARELGSCRIVFFDFMTPALSQVLRKRLESAFRLAGMRFEDYGVFVPWQSTPAFYGLMKRADVFLDTIGFSGFNTAIQAVECGLPIVTRDGRFMRGRLAGGILRRMGLQELVAATNEAYVELAVKLVRDREFRQRICRRMEASRDILFDDVVPVRALEDFLCNLRERN